jgi:hypothetical protein
LHHLLRLRTLFWQISPSFPLPTSGKYYPQGLLNVQHNSEVLLWIISIYFTITLIQ